LLTVSRDPLIQPWLKDSATEKEVIQVSEVGK